MRLRFEDPDFDGQFQRTVAKTDFGVANVGECLAIADQIVEGDLDSWYGAFSSFAERLRQSAEHAASTGRKVTARSQYLRASEYLRAAFFYDRADLEDQRLGESYRAHRDCFRAAMPLLEFPVELVEVPYEATTLTGYLAHADESGRARPTLIHLGGYDGTAEEIFMALAAGTQRDYNVFTFDGPGQGGTLYEKRVVMRPDWENVVPPVVDLLIARPEVDPERVALMGRSFSGYLGVRPAAHDDRIAALLLDPGQYDIGRAIIERLPDGLRAKVHDSSQEVEAAFNELLGTERFRRLFLPRMATHGAQSVRRYVEMMLEYSNEGHAELVRCPTFVTDNESDQVSTGQGAILASHLKAPATFVTFTADMGAEGHCEGLGSVVFLERAFDWLDENIRRG